MFRSLSSSFLALIFSWNAFAVGPGQDELFQRLGIDEAFLNSPVCSVKRDGGALVQDFGVVVNDPLLQSGDVILTEALQNNGASVSDHGNVCAGVVSRFLPRGRTFLSQVDTFQNSIFNVGRLHHIANHPTLVLGYSILGGGFSEDEIQDLTNRLAARLRHNGILVIAAGNDSESLGSEENHNSWSFANIVSRLSPDLRKYVVFVGATRLHQGREKLDKRYSNLAGKLGSHFILAPSSFTFYSPALGNSEIQDGTSFSSPIITGLITRALLANPRLTRDDVIQILFHTANKRNFVSTGDGGLDRSLYGHGMVDAPQFFRTAHALNQARGQNAQAPFSPQMAPDPQPNVFRDFRNNLRDKLDIMNLLDDYEDEDEDSDFKQYSARLKKMAGEGSVNLEAYPASFFKLDDFNSCSWIFKARKARDEAFTQFALSKFPLSSVSEEGGSLLTVALADEQNHLVDCLLQRNFDIHHRGNNSQGKPGPLPIHAATYLGSEDYTRILIERSANVQQHAYADFGSLSADPLFLAVVGSKKFPNVSQRLKILDLLYHEGADFSQKFMEMPFAEFTAKLLGNESPITKKIKYYAENSHLIRRNPMKKNAALPAAKKSPIRPALARPVQVSPARAKAPPHTPEQAQSRILPTRPVPAVAKRTSAVPQRPAVRVLPQKMMRSTPTVRVMAPRKVVASPLPNRRAPVRTSSAIAKRSAVTSQKPATRAVPTRVSRPTVSPRATAPRKVLANPLLNRRAFVRPSASIARRSPVISRKPAVTALPTRAARPMPSIRTVSPQRRPTKAPLTPTAPSKRIVVNQERK